MNFGSLFSFITDIFVFSVMTSLSSVETPVDRRRFVFSSVFCSLLGFISDDYSFVVAFVIYLFTWICICIFRCTFRLSIDVSASLIFFGMEEFGHIATALSTLLRKAFDQLPIIRRDCSSLPGI